MTIKKFSIHECDGWCVEVEGTGVTVIDDIPTEEEAQVIAYTLNTNLFFSGSRILHNKATVLESCLKA